MLVGKNIGEDVIIGIFDICTIVLNSPLRLLFLGNLERQDIREAEWQGGRTSEWQFVVELQSYLLAQ